jgi:hypothetical protein
MHVSEAGGSADAEYERRARRDRERRQANLQRSVAIVVATAIVVYLLALVATHAFLPGAPANLYAALIALPAAVLMATEAWGPRRTTVAWRKGADGERRTAGILAGLGAGTISLHDRRIPGSRANIDHIVFAPTGVFVVETKHWSGRVVVGRGTARRNGRSMQPEIEQARREASVVDAALGGLARLGIHVRPILCIHGATVERATLIASVVVDGVRVCSGRRLRDAIAKGPIALAPDAVARLAGQADLALRPAVGHPADMTRTP